MTYENPPPSPFQPEFTPDNDPVSEATVRCLVDVMLNKMGTSDGWTGSDGDAIVTVHPKDITQKLGNVGYIAVPIDNEPDQYITTDYNIRTITGGYNIEKIPDYDAEAAGGLKFEEANDIIQNIREIYAEEGVDLPDPDVKVKLRLWSDLSDATIAASNPNCTFEAITAQEREFGLLMVTEGEAKRLIGIVKNCVTVEYP